MQWLTWMFLVAVAAETLTRLWLGSRQIAAVQAHRNDDPRAVSRTGGARGSAKGGRLHRRASAPGALGDAGRGAGQSRAHPGRRPRGGRCDLARHGLGRTVAWRAASSPACCCCCSWSDLPFSLWRTFGIEARFGFNRMTPRLYAVDFAKQLLLTAAARRSAAARDAHADGARRAAVVAVGVVDLAGLDVGLTWALSRSSLRRFSTGFRRSPMRH